MACPVTLARGVFSFSTLPISCFVIKGAVDVCRVSHRGPDVESVSFFPTSLTAFITVTTVLGGPVRRMTVQRLKVLEAR